MSGANRRKKSLLTRVVRVNFLLVSVAVVCLTALFLINQLGSFQNQAKLRAEELTEFLASQAAFPLMVGDQPELTRLAQSALAAEGILYVVFADADAQTQIELTDVGFDANLIPDSADAIAEPLNELQILTNRKPYIRYIDISREISPRVDNSILDWQEPDAIGGRDTQSLGSVRIGISLAKAETQFAETLWQAFWVMGLALIVILTSQYLQLRHLLKPLRSLITFTETVAKGQFDTEVPVARPDEIGDLTSAFNRMVGDIRTRDEELLSHREHLEEEVADRTSELVKTNADLREAMSKAEEAARLKSEFLANMSHEIRTPMGIIMGMTDLVLTTDLKEKKRTHLGMAQRSANSLLRIIDDVLDFSKIEADRLDLEAIEFNLYEKLNETTEPLRFEAAAKGLRLHNHIDPETPQVVIGDPDRLAQIITNLVGNAIKFTEHGDIRVSATVQEKTDRDVVLLF